MARLVVRAPSARRAPRLAAALLALSIFVMGGCATSVTTCTSAGLAYVGQGDDRIAALRVDTCTGRLSTLGLMADLPKPRWALVHPRRPILYVASDEGEREASVVAFAIDRNTGGLERLAGAGTGGAGATYLSIDESSNTLMVANFISGSASTIALDADGALGALASTMQAQGSGPHRRQAGPHAHSAATDPSGRWVLVPDLGADRVYVYGLDPAHHALIPDTSLEPRAYVAPPGSGPRHLAFSRDGRFVFLVQELSAEIVSLRWDAATGRLTPLQAQPISSPGFAGTRSGSELVLSRDGRFLYVGDRGENQILVYSVDASTGVLTLLQRMGSGGDMPSSFAVDASGRWMLVANERSKSVRLFGIDAASGRLADTGQSVASATPLSVTFVN